MTCDGRIEECGSRVRVYTEDLLSQSFVRFCNEDEVLPTLGGDQSQDHDEAEEAGTPSVSPMSSVSTSSPPSSSAADTDNVVDICHVTSCYS